MSVRGLGRCGREVAVVTAVTCRKPQLVRLQVFYMLRSGRSTRWPFHPSPTRRPGEAIKGSDRVRGKSQRGGSRGRASAGAPPLVRVSCRISGSRNESYDNSAHICWDRVCMAYGPAWNVEARRLWCSGQRRDALCRERHCHARLGDAERRALAEVFAGRGLVGCERARRCAGEVKRHVFR
jgi:hypothetical protein